MVLPCVAAWVQIKTSNAVCLVTWNFFSRKIGAVHQGASMNIILDLLSSRMTGGNLPVHRNSKMCFWFHHCHVCTPASERLGKRELLTHNTVPTVQRTSNRQAAHVWAWSRVLCICNEVTTIFQASNRLLRQIVETCRSPAGARTWECRHFLHVFSSLARSLRSEPRYLVNSVS